MSPTINGRMSRHHYPEADRAAEELRKLTQPRTERPSEALRRLEPKTNTFPTPKGWNY